MKIILSIIILILFLSGYSYSKDLTLTCKFISSTFFYGLKAKTITKNEMIKQGLPIKDEIYVINANTKKILRKSFDEFVPLSKSLDNFDIVWSRYDITWYYEILTDVFHKSNLNRSTGVLTHDSRYGEKSVLAEEGITRTSNTYKCEISEKLF